MILLFELIVIFFFVFEITVTLNQYRSTIDNHRLAGAEPSCIRNR